MRDAAQFRYRRHAFALIVMLGFGGARFAAQPLAARCARPRRAAPANQRPAVQSPVIEAGRITFNVYAPKAAAVTLRSGELDRLVPEPKPKAMTRGENGVWTIAIGPVPPGIYDYSFDVDGVIMTDPESTNVFGNVRGSRGFVEVPGAAGQPRHDEWRDVPHGAVAAHWYDSKATSSRRRVHVYTPPGYNDANAARAAIRCSSSCTAPATTTLTGCTSAAPTSSPTT